MAFVYLHVIWFALWCIGNLIWWRFDPVPVRPAHPDRLARGNLVHATAKDRIAQSRALASANGSGQATRS